MKTVILIEDTGSVTAHEHAKKLSASTGFEVHKINPQKAGKVFAGEQWQLVFTQQGLALRLSSEPSWSDIRVDFASAALQYRKQHGGGRNEPLAKAIGIKGMKHLHVLDCTAGMGTDSFIMASVGASVTMLERSEVVAALLRDALFRIEDAEPDLHAKFKLEHCDASDYLSQIKNNQSLHSIDVIYMDPMFPHKKKSALVKKEMQAFQRLLGQDTGSEQVLTNALESSTKRIVVKRPNHAEALGNAQGKIPSMEIRSKKHRFDVYLL